MINEIIFQIVDDINKISKFLARRDLDELTCKELMDKFKIKQVDIIIILGNSMPLIAELSARAFKNGLAKDIMIVGGIGHSTKYLIKNIIDDSKFKYINFHGKSEAEILSEVIIKSENIDKNKIIIEKKSTNCGLNASEALKVLEEKNKIPKSIILIQDPTMQLRTHASFLKEWNDVKPLIISYSPFIPQVKIKENDFEFTNYEIDSLWSKERFIDLIMGEIPRLVDNENGYGPKGKGFITHVDVEESVIESYMRLLNCYDEYQEIKERK